MKVELTNNNLEILVGAVVKQALKDLHSKSKSIEILQARNDAKWFFKDSPIFEMTGLNFENINNKYMKIKEE